MRFLLCLSTLILAFSAQLSAEEIQLGTWGYPPALPEAKVETYKTVGETNLNLYIFNPSGHRSNDQKSAIVFFFGGGWRGGTPGQFHPQCKYLASRGMVAITADYRVQRRQGVTPMQCLNDAKSAIRWVRENAKRLGIDPSKIVASGGSAGGHLAAATALVPGFEEAGEDLKVSSAPNAMVLFNPAVMLTDFKGKDYLGEEKTESISERTKENSKSISPIHFVRKGLPPSIIFHGTNDEAVPFLTVQEFEKEMKSAGNSCQLFAFQDSPHGFYNTGRGGSAERQANELKMYNATTRLMDEFLVSLKYLSGKPTISQPNKNVYFRGSLDNSRIQFTNNKKGHVAFIGGSITEMNGYRPMMTGILQNRFPKTEFTFTAAGISSTCSTTGAFRLKNDVLSKGPVDLFFIEFAVNDDQDAGHTRRECVQGLEGIIRQTRKYNPNADIVVTLFVNPGMLETIQSGTMPLSMDAHKTVAKHYGISTIHLGHEVADRIDDGSLTWKVYGGTHPKPAGNRICANLLVQLFTSAWKQPLSEKNKQQPHPMPQSPLDEKHYGNGLFVSLDNLSLKPGWEIKIPQWKQIPGGFRGRFAGTDLICSTRSGSELSLKFSGTAVGAYLLAGPDAGIVEVFIDGDKPRSIDLFHRFSSGLHYPRTVMFATDLTDGPHQLTLRISETHNPKSSGTAMRVLQFVAN